MKLTRKDFQKSSAAARAGIHVLTKRFWEETKTTIVMVTHDISEHSVLARA